jgi:hypothetical protein
MEAWYTPFSNALFGGMEAEVHLNSPSDLARRSLNRPRLKRLRSLLLWCPLISLFFFWEILFLPRLRDSPGWYGDETGTLLMGRELFHGRSAVGSLWLTFWHIYYPYQPGFAWLVGFCSSLTGGDILGARFLNAVIALLIAMLICFWGRQRLGILAAWFGGLLFLSYSQSVIHFRWVYPHNAVALGFVVTVLWLLRPSRPANDWKVGLGLGIAALAHPLFCHAAVSAFLCRIARPRAWLLLALPPALVIVAAFAYVTWSYWPNLWLVRDITELWKYYMQSSNRGPGAASLAENVLRFYSQDFFHVGACVGLLLCCRKGYYPIAVCALAVSSLLLQNRQNLIVFYYQAIVLVPMFALAWAGGTSVVARRLRRWRSGLRWDRVWLASAILLPIGMTTVQIPAVIQGKLTPRNQLWVTQSVPEVELAASWLNDRTSPKDLVIANVNIAWQLKARTADFLQATLWQGFPTEYFPEGIPRERFRYPADVQAAKYAVIGDIDRVWMLGQLNVENVVAIITGERWPVVWSGKYYLIVENPSRHEYEQSDGN